MNNGKDTQKFFSAVVSGHEEYKPIHPWKWADSIDATSGDLRVLEIYKQYAGAFDEHIATSIPLFREVQIRTAKAVSLSNHYGASILDIGGSEGTWVKTIASLNKYTYGVILDPNKDMEEAFNSHPLNQKTKGVVIFIRECFLNGFDGIPVYGEGTVNDVMTVYDGFYQPTSIFDVIHESMTFQFIEKDREPYVKEVLKFLSRRGLFLTEEKLVPDSEEEWIKNEQAKDEYKRQYYTDAQIGSKAEEVLVGMTKNMASETEYLGILQGNFRYVIPYWSAGNFRGYACSNDRETIHNFLFNFGEGLVWNT